MGLDTDLDSSEKFLPYRDLNPGPSEPYRVAIPTTLFCRLGCDFISCETRNINLCKFTKLQEKCLYMPNNTETVNPLITAASLNACVNTRLAKG